MTTVSEKGQNILLTGLPRSGTTLTCSLLNKLPNSVALHEPMEPAKLAGLTPDALGEEIGRYFEEQREYILRHGKARSKSFRGRVPTNHVSDPDKSGVRSTLIDGDEIHVDNVTRPDFSLFIKHPAIFTAALPALVKVFTCFAVVRNPLSVLISWRKSGMPIGKGRVPAAEMFDRRLGKALESEPDTLERQFIWLDYCFERYLQFIPDRILRYEEIIASGGRALSMLHPAAGDLAEPLDSRNSFFLKRDRGAADVARRLLERDSLCWKVYDRTAVMSLLA